MEVLAPPLVTRNEAAPVTTWSSVGNKPVDGALPVQSWLRQLPL
ncbi:hypothetical protein [Polaromonas sp. CG9_12]|nr:hypothetical protein [Polaromonas sp. CG9_12]